MSSKRPSRKKHKDLSRKNINLALNVSAVVVGMLCMAYAAFPLYNLFCRVTGFGGTTQVATELPDKILDNIVTIRFNSDVAPDLPWDFSPEQKEVKVHIGEQKLVFFSATNRSDRALKGTSIYNVVPNRVGGYFNKIQCFCFDEQTIQPGESVTFPVSFFIDPEIVNDKDTKDIKTITLSYTFFKVKKSS